ncbi:MAG: N-acetylmuramic acid 6-phosphate etherase [Planctomycetaceae bacterium]
MADQPAPTTEARNPNSANIDSMSALEIVGVMNDEDAAIAAAVRAESQSIAAAIDVITDRISSGGRLVYIGAGTSGRLGVLDASECPPTFTTPPEMVVGVIAGGRQALTQAIEGAEDLPDAAIADLQAVDLSSKDVLVGIATSGRTPYVLRAIKYAKELTATTVGFSCNAGSAVAEAADIAITPIVGPEIVSGSTRLKAGTATKMVLNMLTTGTMIRLGKTYENLMVDLTATNQKLKERSIRLVRTLTQLSEPEAAELLNLCDGELKTAVVASHCKLDPVAARQKLAEANGHLRAAIEQ